ncbi:coiled-coil domain-containing protein 102A [Mytilus galloprovincialis]|uniref:Adenine phosphoribosyltransferase n=1 Tax=Mytilus galloprovincialis TaxID=29158 RepID=A0A8B6F101_MYTGA|nr:coiled-coil domain-containing protein 102A [Mytilus galloprovincialis]
MTTEEKIAKIKQCITGHPDFPKPGILFRDIFPVLRDASVFKMLIDVLVDHVKSKTPNVEIIVGLDSRGFLFGPIIAQELGISFVPVRKAGKLPGEIFQVTYSLEYGQDKFEIQKDSIKPGAKVVIVDDLLATGGIPPPASPAPSREGSHTPMSQMSNIENDWDDRDEIRTRELEEARARATQMEKTMRWWSDCTSNWREKWSKVRNERNKAREENRQLRTKLEAMAKECTASKRQSEELKVKNVELQKKLGINVDVAAEDKVTVNDVDKKSDSTAVNKSESESNKASPVSDVRRKSHPKSEDDSDDFELAEEKTNLAGLKLDEAQKTLIAERGEKSVLMKTIEKLQLELNSQKTKYDDLKQSKQEALLEITKLKESNKDELSRVTVELEDEAVNRSNMEKKLAELRRELERLQRENAEEYGKRERLETDKFSLERENKKIRIQIEDLKEQIDRKSQQTSAMANSDVKSLQTDLSASNKELNDLKVAYTRLKKTLQEKNTELDHSKRRAEQYEADVKKLRVRIEELKKDLANAEDEADAQGNSLRKQQRENDDLQEQLENLQVQLNHAQNRLQRSNPSTVKSRTPSVKSFDPNELGEDPDSDDSDLDIET